MSRREVKYLEKEKSFWCEWKSIFPHFKRAFICEKLSQTWECTFKICMRRFSKDGMSSISSDLYEETLKPNKSHTNRIIQMVPCKTALIVPHFRSSHPKCSIKNAVLKKVYNFIKNIHRHRCFHVNITKFLRTPILKNICERLLL